MKKEETIGEKTSAKNPYEGMKYIFEIFLYLCGGIVFNGCGAGKIDNRLKPNGEYYVAAYVWPSCHDEPMSRENLWQEGIGEWEIIKKGMPRFKGHYQPRIPLWGYRMDNDPLAWEQKIDAAVNHGVNVFIFDWYWYDGKPFLEEALNNGFLKARNQNKSKFYLMWANHDAFGNMWNPYRYNKGDTILWSAKVDWKNFKIIVNRIISQYFKQSNYFKINGEPVISIYSIYELVQNFNGIEGAKEALDYFRHEVIKAGFSGLHIQGVGRGGPNHVPFLIEENESGEDINKIVSDLGLNSITMYNWDSVGKTEDYLNYGEGAMTLCSKWDSILDIPFFPCISIGWDSTPRFLSQRKESVIHYHNTPVSFYAYLLKIKEYANAHPQQSKLIIINAWNEWVEGSYLEPDMRWGYGYLDSVKKVMMGK